MVRDDFSTRSRFQPYRCGRCGYHASYLPPSAKPPKTQPANTETTRSGPEARPGREYRTVVLPFDLAERADSVRGNVPFSRFAVRALELYVITLSPPNP